MDIHGRIDNDFAYHPPRSSDVASDHERVRDLIGSVAHQVVYLTPESREQSLALTKLEEAMMWANAAIARHQ